MSPDQDLIEELSNFVHVAFHVGLSAMDGFVLVKKAKDVGLRIANAGADEFFVTDMIPTRSQDLRFANQDVLRVLAAYALPSHTTGVTK